MDHTLHLTDCNPSMVDDALAATISCSRLEEVHLERNELESLPGTSTRFKSVRRLYLAGNNFPDFPTGLFSLVTLKHLDLAFAIQALQPVKPSGTDALASLRFLSLAGCGPVPQWLFDFPALESIVLDYGQVLGLRDRVNLPAGLQVIPVNPKKTDIQELLGLHGQQAGPVGDEITRLQGRLDHIDKQIELSLGECGHSCDESLTLGISALTDITLPLKLRKIMLEDSGILQELIDNPL